MACPSIPSLTLWGTSQITLSTTYMTTYTQLVPQLPIVTFDHGQLLTITPTQTYTLSSQVRTQVVSASVVPQQTLYSPCPSTTSTSPPPATTATATGKGAMSAPTFSSASPAQTWEASQFSEAVSLSGSLNGGSSSVLVVSSAGASGGTSQGSTISPGLLSSTSSATSSGLSDHPFWLSSPTDPGALTMTGPSTGLPPSFSTDTDSSIPNSSASASAQDAASSLSKRHAAVLAAGILGGIGALVVLISLVLCWRRRAPGGGSRGGSWRSAISLDTREDYWERRFHGLEGQGDDGEGWEGESPSDEKDVRRGDGGGDEVAAKRLRLTLDLKSKALPSRPASRLSAISAFFAKTMSFPARGGPEPFRGDPGLGPTLNFSRPLRQGPAIAPLPAPPRTRDDTLGEGGHGPLTRDPRSPEEVLTPKSNGFSDCSATRSSMIGLSASSLSEYRRASFKRISDFAPLTFKRLSERFVGSGAASPVEDTGPRDQSRARPDAQDPQDRKGMEWVQSRGSVGSADAESLHPAERSRMTVYQDLDGGHNPRFPATPLTEDHGGYPSMTDSPFGGRTAQMWLPTSRVAQQPEPAVAGGGGAGMTSGLYPDSRAPRFGQQTVSVSTNGVSWTSGPLRPLESIEESRFSHSTLASNPTFGPLSPGLTAPTGSGGHYAERRSTSFRSSRSLGALTFPCSASPSDQTGSRVSTGPTTSSRSSRSSTTRTSPEGQALAIAAAAQQLGRSAPAGRSLCPAPPGPLASSSPPPPPPPPGFGLTTAHATSGVVGERPFGSPQRASHRPPGLSLSRAALSPSIWVDDALLAQYHAGDVSIFSPDTETMAASSPGAEEAGIEADVDGHDHGDDAHAGIRVVNSRPGEASERAAQNRWTESSVGSVMDAVDARIQRVERVG